MNPDTIRSIEREFDILYSEKNHVENIFYSRFNYFIIVFTLFLNIDAVIYVADKSKLIYISQELSIFLLSFLGVILCGLMWRSLYRIYLTLEVIIKSIDDKSPIISNIRNKVGKSCFGNTNKILSIYIPGICTITLSTIAIIFLFKIPAGISISISAFSLDIVF